MTLRLFCGGCLHIHRHVSAALLAFVEANLAVGEREQRVVAAKTDIAARIIFGAALAHENVARDHCFATEFLDAKAPPCGIATVARGTTCFLCAIVQSLNFVSSVLGAAFLALLSSWRALSWERNRSYPKHSSPAVFFGAAFLARTILRRSRLVRSLSWSAPFQPHPAQKRSPLAHLPWCQPFRRVSSSPKLPLPEPSSRLL